MMRTIKCFPNFGKSYRAKATGNSSRIHLELKVGKKVCVAGRVVTDHDVERFADLTDDHNPVHRTKEKIVHGALLNGFLSGVLGTKLPGPGTIVVEQSIRYPKFCYAGDVIEITVEILSMRKIIKCKYCIVANAERIVLEGEGKFVMSNFSIE